MACPQKFREGGEPITHRGAKPYAHNVRDIGIYETYASKSFRRARSEGIKRRKITAAEKYPPRAEIHLGVAPL